MEISIRIINNENYARQCGWTKNHKLVKMYVVGKWRDVGFFTEKQMIKLKHEEEARRKLIINAGFNKRQVKEVSFIKLG